MHHASLRIQTITPFSHSRNITNGSCSSPRGVTGFNFADSRRSINRISTTRPVAITEDESPTINCIKTASNKRALIPAIINENTDIEAFCDPCSDITIIQQSCVLPDSVIQLWTNREFQIVEYEISAESLDDVILPVAVPSLFHTDSQLTSKLNHSLNKDIIYPKNICSEHKSNETLNAVTFPIKESLKDSQFIHAPEEISVSEDNNNDLLEVPNYEKWKIEEPANNVEPLNERDKIKMVKLDSSKIAENRPKDKLMLGTLKGNEIRRKDQFIFLTSARAEITHNVCERHLTNEPGFEFHRHLHLFETGDLALYDWPKQCDRKLAPMFKGPLMIVRPVEAVCYENKSRSHKKASEIVRRHHRPYHDHTLVIQKDSNSEK
ncbi:hypothetical protein AVEN_107832-1 [Araneus ventricosus]|uniref:Uncharacterized protein n=1 Tax=Araneus ventricosus TaxID=182803 RepID=A0A4Y2JE06_ARAVE|nr:hypothetical protein AVEN_107832-1 [Araneus ventricosus]